MKTNIAGSALAVAAAGALLAPPAIAASEQRILYVQLCSDHSRPIAIPIDGEPRRSDKAGGCHAACVRVRDFDPSEEE